MPAPIPVVPWKLLKVWPVGGLLQVGYAEDSDLLLVLSSDGRGVFDCITGDKLARDADLSNDYFDRIKLIALGIWPLQEKEVRVAGLFGGGLTKSTHDGWFLVADATRWPHHDIYLKLPWLPKIPYAEQPKPIFVGDDEPCELRAYGFSETGKSFVIASSCELKIFARE